MKLFKLDFLGVLFLIVLFFLAIVLPSFLIQIFWNSLLTNYLERDLTINIFQGFLLWASVLTLLYASGIFRFSFMLKSLESIDLNSIDDPELREEIERLRIEAKKKDLEE